jgi:hypothetical protein
MTSSTDPAQAPEPIWMVCEGSGSPAHLYAMTNGPISGICSMCGCHAECSINGIALLHMRHDILAELERGDFDG